jgi:hypothetical protein
MYYPISIIIGMYATFGFIVSSISLYNYFKKKFCIKNETNNNYEEF